MGEPSDRTPASELNGRAEPRRLGDTVVLALACELF